MGKPTSKGIEQYILTQEHAFAQEFMFFVQDTLYDYFISTDDLSDYVPYDSLRLGMTFLPADAIITTEEKFIDYALDSLSRFRRKTIRSSAFVKGTVMHELTHVWINQILREMDWKDMYISPEYRNFRIFSSRDIVYGAQFIEEGICEYVANKMGEILPVPARPPEEDDNPHTYKIKYRWAQEFVGHYLDTCSSLKEGIQNIFSQRPPLGKEIDDPEKFWQNFPY